MSGKQTCKRNICKRQENFGRKGEEDFGSKKEDGFDRKNYGCNNEYGYGWNNEDGFKGDNYGWKEDGFKGPYYGPRNGPYYGKGYKNDEFGWKEDNFGWCGEHNGYDDCYRNKYAADRNHFNNAERKEHDRAYEQNSAINKHYKNDTDAHKLDKEFEDRHRRRDQQTCKDLDNVCNRDHSRKNKRYLVDKLYIYEHHRVIDLDCCENDRDQQETHKDFRDLETAIDDFKESDVSVKDFSDENRKDLEAYEASRAKVRDLQAQKKNAEAAYVWSD